MGMFLFVLILVIIFLVEFIDMLFLHYAFGSLSILAYTFLDSLILVVVLAPIIVYIYFSAFGV